ncbi:MAG TPA: porin [Candidatus Baltobacteraceae bacterium]|jgi:phosphate-selective porin OprO/OprP|nr:porin [Candidatus Baltobacteraceae bacterium]
MRSSVIHRAAIRYIASAALFFVLSTPTPSLRAADAPPSTEELLQRINSLEQELKELKAKVEQQQPPSVQPEAPPPPPQPPKSTAFISAGANGFGFQSADTNFAIALHGLLQVDSRTFFSDDHAKGNDAFLLRRARPILSGTVYRDFDFLFTPDFAGNQVQIVDALVNYRLEPQLQLQFGKMKPPVGLEALQAEQYTFFNERSLATDLVPYRDIGVELHGDLFGGVVSYAAGLFNGAPDYVTTTTNTDFDNNKSFDARVFLQPFKNTSISFLRGLGVGVAGTYQLDAGTTNNGNTTGLTQGFVTDGQQKFFTYSNSVASTGVHTRITPQAYYYWGPFGLMGEYVANNDHVSNYGKKVTSANLDNTAWEISGGYVLTGEDASYNGVTPSHPFSPFNGSWGAVQLVGRYAQLNVDQKAFSGYADPTTSASQAGAWSVGLNWYLNNNLRINTSFSETTFEGGSGPKATVTKQPEEVLFTRVQLSF